MGASIPGRASTGKRPAAAAAVLTAHLASGIAGIAGMLLVAAFLVAVVTTAAPGAPAGAAVRGIAVAADAAERTAGPPALVRALVEMPAPAPAARPLHQVVGRGRTELLEQTPVERALNGRALRSGGPAGTVWRVVIGSANRAAVRSPAGMVAAKGAPKDLNSVINRLRTILVGLLVAVSTLFLVVAGLLWVVAGGDMRAIETAKGAVKSAVIGYLVAAAATLIVAALQKVVS